MPAFHVDLRGLVDLLSAHLYSTPEVYSTPRTTRPQGNRRGPVTV